VQSTFPSPSPPPSPAAARSASNRLRGKALVLYKAGTLMNDDVLQAGHPSARSPLQLQQNVCQKTECKEDTHKTATNPFASTPTHRAPQGSQTHIGTLSWCAPSRGGRSPHAREVPRKDLCIRKGTATGRPGLHCADPLPGPLPPPPHTPSYASTLADSQDKPCESDSWHWKKSSIKEGRGVHALLQPRNLRPLATADTLARLHRNSVHGQLTE